MCKGVKIKYFQSSFTCLLFKMDQKMYEYLNMLTPLDIAELCIDLILIWEDYIEETFGTPYQGFSSDSQQKDEAIQRQNIEDFKKAEDKAHFIASNPHTFLYGLACGFMHEFLNHQQQRTESTFQYAGNAEESEFQHKRTLLDLEDPIIRSDDWQRMQNNRRPHGFLIKENQQKPQKLSRREQCHLNRKVNERSNCRKSFCDFYFK